VIKFLNIPAVLYQSQQATEDRSSCLDVLHQNSISNAMAAGIERDFWSVADLVEASS
jgi:hypothetical protein